MAAEKDTRTPLQKIYDFVDLSAPAALIAWEENSADWIAGYYRQTSEAQVYEVILPPAVFLFDCIGDRVVFAYAVSTVPLTKRDESRIRGFPNVNLSVSLALGEQAFSADKGHFLGHASGGQLDIDLFPQQRELNRGWSDEGKLYRKMETHVAQNVGTFFYHRPIYDYTSWIPAQLEYGILLEDQSWWINTFANKSRV